MSALAEAPLAAQRQAVGSLSKAFVAGKISGEVLEAALAAIGCTDAVDVDLLVESLCVLKAYGGEAPKPTGQNGASYRPPHGAGQARRAD